MIPALIGILVTSGGCDGSTGADRAGMLVGMMDGEVWRGNAEARLVRDTLYIISRRYKPSPDQWLTIAAAPTVVETYAVVTGGGPAAPSRYEEVVGGDVTVYSAAATSGTLVLGEPQRGSTRVAGTVELTLQGPRGTSRFTSGEFDAPMRLVIP